MRRARIRMHGEPAGTLIEADDGSYSFEYDARYAGAPISLTLPVSRRTFHFPEFPAVFDGLLPEGTMLAGLLLRHKIDRADCFAQLVTVGRDLVGAITVEPIA